MSQRSAIVTAAVAELGQGNRPEYWRSALGRDATPAEMKKAWCGIFALYCLHEAGVALDVHWRFGHGFLLQPPHPLKPTRSPLPGDIGYQDQPSQHHFIVESVTGALVHSVDGNQGKPGVQRKTRGMGPQLVFYSIEPLLTDDDPTLPPPPATPHWSSPSDVQQAVNLYLRLHGDPTAPAQLNVDGIIGPKSTAAIKWVQAALGIPQSGLPDSMTCARLGL